MLSQIVSVDKDFEGFENAKQNSGLVHIIYIFRENGGIG
jgi:hypothetical protein